MDKEISYFDWKNYLDQPDHKDVKNKWERLISLGNSLKKTLDGTKLDKKKESVATFIFEILNNTDIKLNFDIDRIEVSPVRLGERSVPKIKCKMPRANLIFESIKREKGVAYMMEASIKNLQFIADVIWDLKHSSVRPKSDPSLFINPRQLRIPFDNTVANNLHNTEIKGCEKGVLKKGHVNQNDKEKEPQGTLGTSLTESQEDEDPNQNKLYEKNDDWWKR